MRELLWRGAHLPPTVEPLESRIAPAFGAVIDLSALSGADGFQLDAVNGDDLAGYSVSAAGDVNGDGVGDVIIGAPGVGGSDQNIVGAAYVIFGRTGAFPANFALDSLDGVNGFSIFGTAEGSGTAESVSGAGDINGDGYDDVVIAASGTNVDVGLAYAVFGRAAPFEPVLLLTDLNGANGFKMVGNYAGDSTGYSVSGAGDMNGDGFADIILGSPGLQGTGEEDYSAGGAYVVFGSANAFPAELALDGLSGPDGFRVRGAHAYDYTGTSVSGAGDLNGDGFDDVIIGAPGTNYEDYDYSSRGVSAEGQSKHAYVIFGRQVFGGELRVSQLNGNNGFQITGEDRSDYFGSAVSGAGDINGDGFDDLIIGAPAGYAYDAPQKSFAYVLFGKANFAADLNVGNLNGNNGFRVAGTPNPDYFGSAVSGAGDINGDGFDDVLITTDYEGEPSYVIFGKARNFPATLNAVSLDGRDGFKISYEAAGDSLSAAVSAAGDLNGDGIDDFLVGVPSGGGGGGAYVVFGGVVVDPPIQPDPQTMIFTDADGDRVTVQVSQGTLDVGNVVLTPSGQGFLLEKIDLSGQPEFEGASLAIFVITQSSFAGGPMLGDGKVNVGTVDATGVNLRNVKITGDVGMLRAGLGQTGKLAVRKMEFDSLGKEQSNLFGAAQAGLAINGGVGKIKVFGDVLDFAASIGVGQEAGLKKMTVGGAMTGSSFDVGNQFGALRVKGVVIDTDFSVASNFGKVTVDQEITGSNFVVGGTLHTATFKAGMKDTSFKASGALGTVIVAKDVETTLMRAGTLLNNFVVGGSLIDSTVSAPGALLPKNGSKAQAFGIIGVQGDVVRSQILAGYDKDGLPVNADAGIGKVVIKGKFEASSIVAGASAGVDGFFGNADDALLSGGNDIVAKIASITIKGAVLGTAANPADHFGIVAEELGKLKVGGTALPFTPGPRNDLAGIGFGATDDVRAREVG